MRKALAVMLLLAATGWANAEEDPGPPDPETRAREYIDQLTSDDAGRRFTATVELGRLGLSLAIEPLLDRLGNDRDHFVRRAAARSLGSIGSRRAVPGLITALGDSEIFVALQAAKTLRSITGVECGFREHLSAEQRASVQAKWRAWWAKQPPPGPEEETARGEPAPARPEPPAADRAALVEELSSDAAGTRFQAAVELGKLRDVRAVAPLVRILATDPDYFVRRACARALGQIRDRKAVPALIDALTDKEVFVACQAASALKQITGRDPGLAERRENTYVATATPEKRRELQARFRTWWVAEGSKEPPPEDDSKDR